MILHSFLRLNVVIVVCFQCYERFIINVEMNRSKHYSTIELSSIGSNVDKILRVLIAGTGLVSKYVDFKPSNRGVP